MIMEKMYTTLRYEGKYDVPYESRQWTIVSRFTDSNGCDRTKGTFGIAGLIELGIIKGGK